MSSPTIFKSFAVVIKNHYEPTYSLRITIESGDTNVGKLKCIVQEQHKGNPAVQDQLLVFRGKLLDSKTTLFNLLKSSNLADENTPCMYIHMTLRGGSQTATKIGLNSTSSNSQAPSQHTQPSPPAQSEQKAEATAEAEEEEEEKCVQPATSSASPPVSSRARAPVHAYPHPPHHHPHHPAPPYPYAAASAHPYPYPYPPPYAHAYPYGVMPPPPPPPGSLPPAPHAMAFSQSMPDLMAPPHMYRQSSAPSHPSHQTFAPPTLVQQTSNPSQPSSSSSSSSHPPPPAVPYPYPPPWPYAHPHPHAHAHPSAPPMPPYGLHAYSTSDLYHPRDPRIRSAKKKKHSQISSKISQIRETTTTEDDQKFVHADADHNVPAPALAVDQIDDNGNRQPFRGLYGLRQRRGNRDRAAAAVNDNVAVAANENNVVNANENNNNANANAVVNAANNNNVVPRDGIMVRLFRLLNVNVLIRLAIFMWLFGPNLGTNRFSILCIMGGLYYLHQVGVLHAVLNRFGIGRNRNANEPQHRDPNAAAAADDVSEEEHSAPPPPPSRLTHAQLLQRFLVGLVASLWPTWDHRTLYPAVRQ